ncbi:tetratricopeptide repeat protein [Clostridium tepidum]|jgi:tetratricopeptide (TPR) repeat protein|uniref:Capsular biosynthesis protein n=1 Tax=Clostridium tepidum TaxID=1962263 RepID=A0A1S9I0G7_9CLOT|nr:tetratricopeptide repeat protein [Clostridium tepidum]MCR1935377.1 tetratricopeptide repeat protein [Clostridium tepidum]MDU6878656.1 tetratricopeptide repeat protein [Clostridium botulinum]OOO61530.1 capsular biosynthesis protein [Clostridium tepidum]OOO63836.1 capsular biosynthesis protein [Clostridium tepidum]
MEIKSYFAEKLSKILFLEVKKEKISEIFKVDVNENIYVPLKSKSLVEEIKQGEDLDNIPITFFIEGMFFVLGADEKFKFNNEYKDMLSNIPKSEHYIKGVIFEEVKRQNYEDAYILLKGLSALEEEKDIYDKLILILENLRQKDKMYKEEELNIIERAKKIKDYEKPYLYESIIKKEDSNFKEAWAALEKYISMGGEQTTDIIEYKNSLEDILSFEEGKRLIGKNPKEALMKLIPIMNKLEDNTTTYYYVAVAYRMMGNHDKAIYYLNKALEIDNGLIDAVNELAINYAALEKYDIAIKYLRKAFQVEKSIEICTNLIMCYINKGDLEQAQNHIDIAKKINPEDEILKEIENYLSKHN